MTNSMLPVNDPFLHGPEKLFGIFGYPIAHSLSPLMHNTAFRHLGLPYLYLPFLVHPQQLAEAVHGVRALGIQGINVTIPHKEAMTLLVDRLTPEAQIIGAINTVLADGNTLIGHNTDGTGFLTALEQEAHYTVAGKTMLLLGAGGSAKAIAVQLALAGIHKIILANRTRVRAEMLATHLYTHTSVPSCAVIPFDQSALATAMQEVDLIVNATAIGLESKEELPLPVEQLSSRHLVCDIVYRPLLTPLLRAAQQCGARVLDGLEMLIYQGALAFQYWIDSPFPVSLARKALHHTLTPQST